MANVVETANFSALKRHWLSSAGKPRAVLVTLLCILGMALRRLRGRVAYPLFSIFSRLKAVPPPPPVANGNSSAWARRPKESDSLGLTEHHRYGVGRSDRAACKKFALGCCNFGNDCYFSHSYEAQAAPLKKKDVCTYIALGMACKSKWCKNAHGKEELAERLPIESPSYFPAAGFTYYDSHCHLDGILLMRRLGYHWPYKTKLCRDFMEDSRQCPYPTHCAYAHGEQDRRKRPPMELSDFTDLLELLPPGFKGLVHNCCDEETIEDTLTLVQWGRDILGGGVYVSFGMHPTEYFKYNDDCERRLLDAFDQCGDRAVAWGECGLDYYRKVTVEEKLEMCNVFVRQIELAVARDLPLIVHSRDAEEDVLDVLRDHLPRNYRMHLHSYQGTWRTLTGFLDLWPNCYIGINGVATYKTALDVLDVVDRLPLERFILETDGPFMIPEPYRYDGGGSHMGHIPWVAKRVGEMKNVDPAIVLEYSNKNFFEMYGISLHSE